MRSWLKTFPARVLEGLAVAALIAVGGVLLDAGEVAVPAWVAILAVAVLVAVGLLLGRRGSGNAARARYFLEHVRESVESLQKGVVGEIPGLTWALWVERGIMGPACHWLAQRPGEEIRMSVIHPRLDAPAEFKMVLEAGHSLDARQNFSLPVAGSFAGHALQSGVTQWTNDVDNDPRWTRHPQARKNRSYGSLVSVPIKRADGQPVGVFNVISSGKGAFSPVELGYIELLGSLVNFAWTMDSEYGDKKEPDSAGA